MKKYIFLAIVTIAVLSACSKENSEIRLENQPVCFTANIARNVSTRASGALWTNGDKIGVRMFDAAGAIVTAYDNIPYTANLAGALTPASTNMYYPLNGSGVGFSAYYPYKQGITDTYTVNLADQSKPEAIDLLYAKTTVIYNKRSSAVPLTFSHQLSKFVIKTKKRAGLASLDGMTVTTKCRTTASFNLKSGELNGYADLATITFKEVKKGEEYEAIILPITDAATVNSMTVSFAIGVDIYEWKVPASAAFAAGKSHEWEVSVTRTGVSGFTSTITDWKTVKEGNGTAD